MPNSKMMSTWTSGREQGTHVFHICGYSQHRSTARGEKKKTILSSTFSVGGHNWAVLFHPDGWSSGDEIVAGLVLTTRHVKVRASYELQPVDRSTGLSVSVHKETPRCFHFDAKDHRSFISFFMKKWSIFELSAYLWDDCLTMECTITVIKEPRRTEIKPLTKIQVPRSDLSGHYAKLWEDKVGVDVAFSVGGEEFTVHKVVLAARSPVFRAQLYGPMREAARAEPIDIEDMQPAVFRELLHFIYTDSLPPLDHLRDDDDRTDLIRHLLVAADRYGMERLSLMCQSILCETWQPPYQHQCDVLKDACLEFFITCSTAIDDVKKTQGYKNLKRTCPPDVIEAFEKASRFRKA
ncbi:BTB/POZ and MATH domain-containing protein 2-like [Panicum miliaceum]|uniref:BTB/POZ and MATH domain-containing protein 2-like n=1 Tax=Panicum miliaceum TaxID=4540 RepID=A0A3L6TD22_PANMI|nr:BTB/POZ and MATH domain-containing protein 2-like [Panicum miliaceum]